MLSLGYSNRPRSTRRASSRRTSCSGASRRWPGRSTDLSQLRSSTSTSRPTPRSSTPPPELDDELNVVVAAGEPKMGPVGSTAVREAIERFQPMLALHGHVHESRGRDPDRPHPVHQPGQRLPHGPHLRARSSTCAATAPTTSSSSDELAWRHMTADPTAIEPDLEREARRLLSAIEREGLDARLIGGMAILLLAGDRLHPRLRPREIQDLDFVLTKRHRREHRAAAGRRGLRARTSSSTRSTARAGCCSTTRRTAARSTSSSDRFEMCHELPAGRAPRRSGPTPCRRPRC